MDTGTDSIDTKVKWLAALLKKLRTAKVLTDTATARNWPIDLSERLQREMSGRQRSYTRISPSAA